MFARLLIRKQNIPIVGALLLAAGLAFLYWQRGSIVPINTTTIHYSAPQASRAWLVWGVNGWQRVPNAQRPVGTVIQDGAMRSPMQRVGDGFAIDLVLQGSNSVDFGVSVDYAAGSGSINVWDSDGGRNYRILTPRIAPFVMTPTAFPNSVFAEEGAIVEQAVQYKTADAAAVTLVWGVDGWNVVPEALALPNTNRSDDLMHTEMTAVDGVYAALIPVPAGARLDFLFEVETSTGQMAIDANIDGQNYTTPILLNTPIVIESALGANEASKDVDAPSSEGVRIRLFALIAFSALSFGWLALLLLSPNHSTLPVRILTPFSAKRFWIAVLASLVSVGFVLLVYYRSFDFYRRYNRDWNAMPPLKYLYLQFDLTEDAVFVSWLVATLFLLTALGALLCFLMEQNKLWRGVGWLGPVTLSGFFSLSGFLPETTQSWITKTASQGATPLLAPTGLAVVVLGAFGGVMLLLLLLRLLRASQYAAALLAAGCGTALIALAAPPLAARFSFNLLTLPLPALVLIRGGLLLGAACWLTAVVRFGYELSQERVGQAYVPLFELDGRLLAASFLLLVALLGLELFFQRTPPVFSPARGWLFVLLGSALAALALQLRTQTQTRDTLLRNLYGFLAGVSLLLSLFLATLETDWYMRLTAEQLNATLLFQTGLGLALLFLFYGWFVFVRVWQTRFLLIAALPLVLSALFPSLPAAGALRFFGAALLLFVVLAQLIYWQPLTHQNL